MLTNFLKHYSLLRFACITALLCFLLITTSLYAHGVAHQRYKTYHAQNLRKDDPKPRMFFIAVIDSNDDSIGVRCQKDLEQMQDAFTDIADWIDVEMAEPKIISGDEYSKAAVNDAIDNWLKNQQPVASDIVIFYYSGHGFRYPADVSNYPRMWLKTVDDKNIETNNLQIEDVYNRIKQMGAGVNIVLSDCCNNTAAADNANFDNVTVPTLTRQTRKREHPRDENATDNNNDEDDDYGDKLFITDQPLNILATAAGKGELAGGKPNTGGFFTRYFLEALDECIWDNSIQPSWQNIFDYANDKANYWARSGTCPLAKHNEQGRCIQTAAIKINGTN